VVALRILKDKVSTDTIELYIDKLSSDATAMVITNLSSDPVEGVISGIAATVLPRQTQMATFLHSKGGGDSNLNIDWYLDGNHLGTGQSISFAPSTGSHRLDAIAATSLLGSIGGATWPFRASVESQNGTPLIISDIKEGDVDSTGTPYRLSQLGSSAFLRDGRLLIANDQGFQLLEMVHDQPKVVKTFISSGQALDPYPTRQLSSIIVDTADDLIITTSKVHAQVTLYAYNSQAKELTLLTTLKGEIDGYWGSSILNPVIDAATNTLYVFDTEDNRVYFGPYNPFGIQSLNRAKLSIADTPTHLSLSSDGQRIGLCSAETGKFRSFYLSTTVLGVGFFPEFTITTETAQEDNFFATISGNVILLNLSDGLYPYIETAQGTLERGQRIGTYGEPITSLVFDSTHTACWLLYGGETPQVTNTEVIYGIPSYQIGTMSTEGFVAKRIIYSPKGNFMALHSANRLMVLRISDA
jgi:hypothetical protein